MNIEEEETKELCPSGNLLHSYSKCRFIVDVVHDNGDFPSLCTVNVYQGVLMRHTDICFPYRWRNVNLTSFKMTVSFRISNSGHSQSCSIKLVAVDAFPGQPVASSHHKKERKNIYSMCQCQKQFHASNQSIVMLMSRIHGHHFLKALAYTLRQENIKNIWRFRFGLIKTVHSQNQNHNQIDRQIYTFCNTSISRLPHHTITPRFVNKISPSIQWANHRYSTINSPPIPSKFSSLTIW